MSNHKVTAINTLSEITHCPFSISTNAFSQHVVPRPVPTEFYLILVRLNYVVLLFVQLLQFVFQPTAAILDVLRGGARDRDGRGGRQHSVSAWIYVDTIYMTGPQK